MAAFTLKQNGVSFGKSGDYSSVSVALASNPTAGSVVAVRYLFYDGGTTPPSITSIKDGNDNAYAVEAHNSGSTNMDMAGFIGQGYVVAPSNAEKTITVTFSKTCGSDGVLAIWIDEFAPPAATTASYDDGEVGNGTEAINTPTIPVSGTEELVVSVASDAYTVNSTTGSWISNAGGNQYNNNAAYILSVSSSTAVGFQGSSGNVYNAIGMSFKAVASKAIPVFMNQYRQRRN